MSLRWLIFAWRNTLRNRRRSLVTVVIAALGTAAVQLASGFALFTYQGLAQDAARTTGHLVIAKPAQFLGDEDVPLEHGLDNAQALKKQLLALPSVRQVLPRVEFSGLISNGDKSTVMLAYGIEPDAEFAIKGPFVKVLAGEILSNADSDGVLLGEGLARTLKAKPGSGLTLMATTTEGALNAQDVTVKGVISSGIPDVDLRLVYLDAGLAQRLLGTTRVSSIGVFLNRIESTGPMQRTIAALLPGLEVRRWDALAPYYQSVKALYNRIFGALGLILCVIVVFVVVNAMAMTVVERTREIGTLRALGTLPGQLTRSFSLEGLILGTGGAALGTLIALGVALVLLFVPLEMPPPPGRSVGYPLQIAVEPVLFGAIVLAMVVMSALASAVVARRTVHLPIVDALGHV